ncbi:YdcF family protein [uncultured Algimonas sp.]|uniref:YdcF family protein n=1 Tax=uncultured Algimonas sp. TaxID=1547920 RepID=UPI002639366E|nr:YdcF family protein [uncultured Algimonas sp.]
MALRFSRARKRASGRRRLFGFLLLLLIGAFVGGFIAFASHVDGLDAPADPLEADGIVVWTGPGGGRLEKAGDLLERGLGERLLVSGVNTSLSEDDVADLVGLSARKAGCCMDVDYAALDTRGNARETADWAEALGYRHVILVTSSYHMPRAQVEIGSEMAALRITPVPVRSEAHTPWWKDRDRFERVLGEYGKYLLALARGRSESEAAREPVLPEEGLATPTKAAAD